MKTFGTLEWFKDMCSRANCGGDEGGEDNTSSLVSYIAEPNMEVFTPLDENNPPFVAIGLDFILINAQLSTSSSEDLPVVLTLPKTGINRDTYFNVVMEQGGTTLMKLDTTSSNDNDYVISMNNFDNDAGNIYFDTILLT